ncbi:MAG: glucokinase [Candidatus Epulonipiscioides saccharophilum]|nr:MAG: glucokinase [Epulopiscium sp. AS2M-Bin001]
MYYIGVDLGGTNIVVGLVNEEGKILDFMTWDTKKERPVELIFDDIIKMTQEIISRNNLEKDQINGIGIGSPGIIDSKEGEIVYSNNIVINNFYAVKYIEDKTGIKTKIANDADCAALGEVVAGAAKGFKDAIVITLGTGVGSGIVIDGKIFNGFFPGGAEVGHQIIVKDGEKCTCGNQGCFEAYASATALIKMANRVAKKYPESKLADVKEEDMTAKIPFDLAWQGDKVALNVINNYIDYLAIGINNIINIFKPQVLLIGGGVSRQGDKLIKPLIERVQKMVFGGHLSTEIKVAILGNDAGLVGAAMLNQE